VIVVDTNVIAYFLLKGPHTLEAEGVYKKDRDWIAPPLWRSEFRNVLILSIRQAILSLDEALSTMDRAERLMMGHGYQKDSSQILRLAAGSGCSAHDCEFVALALELGVPMVSSDRMLIQRFKPKVISMKAFCS